MIATMAFSPDCKQLALWARGWGDDSKSRLIFVDTATGEELRSIAVPGGVPFFMQWRADGHGLALMKTDLQEHYLWQFTNPIAPPTVSENARSSFMNHEIIAAAVSPNGRWLATGRNSREGKEEPIELWDARPNSRLSDQKPQLLGKQVGHCEYVAFSADSERLFALSSIESPSDLPPGGAIMPGKLAEKSKLIVYEVPTGRQLKTLEVATPREYPSSSAGIRENTSVGLEGNSIFIGDYRGTIHVYDWAQGIETSSYVAHPAGPSEIFNRPGVNAITFSPDGRKLFTSGRYGPWTIRDAATGKVLTSVPVQGGSVGKIFTFSGNGTKLAVAASNSFGFAQICDPNTGQDLLRLPGHACAIEDLLVLRDGTAMTGGYDHSVRWWNLEKGLELKNRPVDLPQFMRNFSVFTNDGRGIVAWKENHLFHVDLDTGAQTAVLENVPNPWEMIRGVSGSTIFVLTADKKVQQVEARTGKMRQTFDAPKGSGNSIVEHFQAVMSADEKRVAMISSEVIRSANMGRYVGGQISLYDAKTGELRKRWHDSETRLECVEFSADNRYFAVGGMNLHNRSEGSNDLPELPISLKSGLVLFNAQTGEPIRGYEPAVQPRFGNSVRTVAISPDSQLIAVVREGNSIVVHELATGEICRVFRGHLDHVTRMAFTADCRRLVSVSEDMTGLVWDVSYRALASPAVATRDSLWTALAQHDWSEAGPASSQLAAKPDELFALVKDRLPAADKPDFVRDAVIKWIGQLETEKGEMRERAIVELSRIGREILPLLREQMSKSSDNGKSGMKRAIDLVSDQPIPKDRLRPTRVVALLAQIHSPESRRELERLAGGHPQADLSRIAKSALARQQ